MNDDVYDCFIGQIIRFNQDFDSNDACVRHTDLNMKLGSISCDKQTKKYSHYIFI